MDIKSAGDIAGEITAEIEKAEDEKTEKKKRKQRMVIPVIVVAILILSVIVIVLGIMNYKTEAEKNKFIGTWRNLQGSFEWIMTFYDNGTVRSFNQYLAEDGTFENYTIWYTFSIADNKLCITDNGVVAGTECMDYDFSNNDTQLILIENTIIFDKI